MRCSFFAYFAVTGPGYAILNVKQASFAETVGVPIQQLAKSLINNGSLSRENEQYINELMDKEEIEEVFNNRLVDPVKWSDGFNDGLLNDDKRKFIFVWLESMPSNFKSYFVAWRDLTLGYWYAGSNAALVAAPGYYAQGILEESDGVNWPEEAHPDGVNILQLNKITGPETFRSQIDVLRGTRVVGLVFNIAFMAWFAVGVCCWLYCRKAALYIIALLPLLLLWFTMLVAAPAFCQLRYMFSFEIALPFLMTTLCFSFSKK